MAKARIDLLIHLNLSDGATNLMRSGPERNVGRSDTAG
jgi:hypothetical protein